MKKLNAISYQSKKRRIDEELQSHFSNFSSLERSPTINNSINDTSDKQITENLVVSNNYDLLPVNKVLTNNAYLNIQEPPLQPEMLELFYTQNPLIYVKCEMLIQVNIIILE